MDPSPITKRNTCSFFATLDDLYSLAASGENTMCHNYSMYCSVPGFATNNCCLLFKKNNRKKMTEKMYFNECCQAKLMDYVPITLLLFYS